MGKIMIVALSIFMLLAVFIEYQCTLTVAKNVADNVQIMLDAYTIQTGKEIVNQIKSGNDYTRQLNPNLFLKDYYKALGINENFEGYREDKLRYRLENIETNFIFDQSLKTEVTFNMTLPLYFLGVRTVSVDVLVKLESRYILIVEEGE